MRYNILLSFLTVSFLLSPYSHANTEKIERIKRENSGYYEIIEQNKRSIISTNGKIEKATEALKGAKQSLDKYEEAFASAQEKYNQDSSPENLRILEMNDDRRTLAIKKVAAREKRVNELKEKIDQLTLKSSSLEALIEKNSIERKRLEDVVDNRKIQAATSAKQKSPNRIKAPVLPTATLQPIQDTAPEKSNQDKIVIDSPLPPTKSTSIDNMAEIQGAQITPDTDSSADAPDKPDSGNSVANAIAEIKEYLSGDVSQSPKTRRRFAKIHMGKKFEFSHLGGEIYSGEVELKSGKNTISFDDSRFRINVSDDNHGKIHVLYIDNRNENRRILFMEKSLADKI